MPSPAGLPALGILALLSTASANPAPSHVSPGAPGRCVTALLVNEGHDVSEAAISASTHLASEVWRREGVRIEWRRIVQGAPAVPPASGVTITISRWSAKADHPAALGSIQWSKGHPGHAIAVSSTAITNWITPYVASMFGHGLNRLTAQSLMYKSKLFPKAIAYVMAHEIGHFVLRSPGHADAGLMAPGYHVARIAGGPVLGLDAASKAQLQRQDSNFAACEGSGVISSAIR